MNVRDRRHCPASWSETAQRAEKSRPGTRGIVHTGRLWLLRKKTLPNTILDPGNRKHRHIIARLPAAPEAAPGLPDANQAKPTSRPLAESSSPERASDQASTKPGGMQKLCPHSALRTFGLLGLGVVVVLTFVLELLSYTSALGQVVELFDRVRLIATAASAAALFCLVALAFRRRSLRRGHVAVDGAVPGAPPR